MNQWHEEKRNAPSALAETFLALESKLARYLQRFLVRQQDIEDAVQKTFVCAYEAEKSRKIEFPRPLSLQDCEECRSQ